jgi:hypothetical protein
VAITRKQALNRIEGLVPQIEEHVRKLTESPHDEAAGHWRAELRSWLAEVRQLLTHVGKRTAARWEPRLQAWEGHSEDE